MPQREATLMLDTEIERHGCPIRIQIDTVGRHTVRFNDEVVAHRLVWGLKGEHCFERAVSGQPITFQIILVAGLAKCRCRILENGQEVHASEHRLSWAHLKDSLKFNLLPQAPRWAWVFIGLCLLIPVVTLGGAVPTMIGFLGASLCSASAAHKQWRMAVRVIACVLVSVASWIGLACALVAFHSAFGKG